MNKDVWLGLTPKKVSSYISFERDNPSWVYDSNDKESMPAKQAEGVAHLWNTMAKHDVAILADEVGMGKTFQALGIACLLWKAKPNAKILVMTPNRDICAGWINEYDSFLRNHYKSIDHLVTNIVDGGSVNKPIENRSIRELVKNVSLKAGSFYFTTIHALSGLIQSNKKEETERVGAAAKAAKAYNEEIRANLVGGRFDLLIIDEAHYFRNVTGSQRAAAAKEFFGSGESKLAQKILLLTATPTHSSSDNVRNILSYFVKTTEDQKPEELLQKYALRRLRLMKGSGGKFHNKHAYRDEKEVVASFENDPMAEMFFALYQKKLVDIEGSRSGGKSFLYGYLEGFESFSPDQGILPKVDAKDDEEDDDSQNVKQKNAFRKAEDTQIMNELTEQYHKVFKQFPAHPKYDALINLLIPQDIFSGCRDLHDDKHLVFVRRIPSVRELTQRANEKYDDKFIGEILKAWGLKKGSKKAKPWRESNWSREGFQQMIEGLGKDKIDNEVDEASPQADEGEDISKLGSKVAGLFVVKKGKASSTDCSNVRLRFVKSESLFALFMEPALDYKEKGYKQYIVEGNYTKDLLSIRVLDHCITSNLREFESCMPTAWGLMYQYLDESSKQQLSSWQEKDKYILENFANYIKKGFLYASPVMVELYCWFTKFRNGDGEIEAYKNRSVQQRYLHFIRFVEDKIEDSLMLVYFKSAIQTFEQLCEKISKDHALSQYEKGWDEFTNLQSPAWYASGESGNRSRLILGFNSPFYPNILVATSVFQEGVNLHLQCKNVHHYGIAWTAGDTEQRIGRVDRLFGKVNHLLEKHGDTELGIHYPYLKNSFDQDQISSFFVKKAEVDSKLDNCLPQDVDKSIELTSVDWKKLMRKKNKDSFHAKDPYKARRIEVDGEPYQTVEVLADTEYVSYLRSLFQSVVGKDGKFHDIHSKNSHNPNALFLIDPNMTCKSGDRKQPVLVEQHYSSEFSCLVDGTVYIITLKTPLCIKKDLTKKLQAEALEVFNQYTNEYPLVQLVLDECFSESNFYFQMKVDLPFFVDNDKNGMLSKEEVNMAFQQLKLFGDKLESKIFNRDLTKDKLEIYKHIDSVVEKPTIICSRRGDDLIGGWIRQRTKFGEVVKLSFTLQDKLEPLEFNGQYAFVKSSLDGNRVELVFPMVDFQVDEQYLLKAWFGYVLEGKFGLCAWRYCNE
jgi:superfamily II DNA or RNA helicase